jgi:hypothetical protein
MTRNLLVWSLSLAGLFGSAASATAVEPSGTALAVVQSASAEGGAGQRLLQVSAPVYAGDRVKTGSVGEAQIRFRDNTKLVVGPNSQVLIDRFVFNPDSTARSVSINAVRGTLRFISGNGPKNAYAIRTATATIGIRGTRFDVAVVGGVTYFALYEGGARLCDRAGRSCVELRGRCDVAMVPPGRGAQKVSGGVQRLNILSANFPYLRSQARLRPEFRADTSSCQINKAQKADAPSKMASVSPSDPGGETGGDTGGETGGESGSAGNHSGLGDGTNPGKSSGNNNSGNNGTGNPGGSK